MGTVSFMIIGVELFLKDLFGTLMFPEVLKQSMESSSSKIKDDRERYLYIYSNNPISRISFPLTAGIFICICSVIPPQHSAATSK